MALILKWAFPSKLKVGQDYAFTPTVSILLPCFNEGRTVYETIESISKSNYPRDKFEIICVDDCSVDDSLEWMLKAQRDFTAIKITVDKNPTNSGKVASVNRALAHSKSEIILSIDSDCIFDPEVMRELISCFADPRIGAVGGQVGIRNVNQSWFTVGQVLWYYLAFNLGKVSEIWTHATTCISGCLFCIRRDIMNTIAPLAAKRKFLGISVIEGEDRFMTHMVLLLGYRTHINIQAKCWTTVPAGFTQLFKQQLRWRRSALRDTILTLFSIPEHIKKLSFNYTYTVLGCLVIWVVILTACFSMLWWNIPFWTSPEQYTVALTSAALCALIIKAFAPEQQVFNPLKLFAFIMWGIVDGLFITLLAFCTLDVEDWGTRIKKVEDINEG